MDDDQREQISKALHGGLYALLRDDDVTKMEAIENLRAGIRLVNDHWGIDTGYHPDLKIEGPHEVADREEAVCYPKEFHDQKTGSWLAITETELVVLAGAGTDPAGLHRRFDLESVEKVQLHALPGPHGMTAIHITASGTDIKPPLRFGTLSYALDIVDALRQAAHIQTEEA